MESKRHMLEGITRLEDGDLLTALRHFYPAIGLREALPWRDDVESAWVLAAAWINRSDVPGFVGEPEEAIRSLARRRNFFPVCKTFEPQYIPLIQ